MRLSKEEKEIYWSGHIKNWRQSGLSQTAYCKQEDVSLCQLGYWLKKEKSISDQTPEQSGFVKIGTPTHQFSVMNYAFQLRIGDTISLQWQGEASPHYIQQLVKAFSA